MRNDSDSLGPCLSLGLSSGGRFCMTNGLLMAGCSPRTSLVLTERHCLSRLSKSISELDGSWLCFCCASLFVKLHLETGLRIPFPGSSQLFACHPARRTRPQN